ncbi:MAG: PGF-pre-PGF domain-containing protein, partial [Nanoarchaeota archaeon]
VVSFINPLTGVNLSIGTQAFNATVTDALTSVSQVLFQFSNGTKSFNVTTTNMSGNWNTNVLLTRLIEGVHTATVYANDSLNNVDSSSTITVRVDRTAPTVNLYNISFNTSSTTPKISYNFTDAVSLTANCTMYMNGVHVASTQVVANDTDAILTASTQSVGSYVATINCTDASGNKGNGSAITIIVDNVAPVVSFINPLTGVNLSSGTQAFNATVSDALTSVNQVLFQFSNGTNPFNVTTTNMSGNWNTNVLLTRLTEGVHNVTVYANDSVNNMDSTASILVRVDRTAPTVNLYNTSFNTSSTTPKISYNFTDAVSLTANCTMYMNGVHVASTQVVANDTDAILTASTQSVGSYVATINCTDASGNKGNSSAITILIDRAAPAVTINAPTTQWYKSNFTINATITDTSAFKNVTYRYETSTSNGSWITLKTAGNNYYNITFDIKSVPDGNYTIRINATDIFGNSNNTVTVANVGVDDTEPSVTFSCTPESVNNYGIVTCTCSATDSGSGVSSIGGYDVLPDTVYEGTFTQTCSVNDKVANSAFATATYTVTRANTGGGGGGSGGSSSSSTATKTSHTVAMSSVSAGSTGSVSISKTNMPVTKISFTVKQSVASPSVTVSALSSRPVSVSAPAGKTVRYLEVSVKNLDNSNVDSAAIQFKVKKSELTDMGISENDIVLSRYTEGKWTTLPTTKVTGDANDVTFEAISPGFSYFAITAKSVSTAFGIIDTINSFYTGATDMTAFNIIDQINSFYGQ